MTDITAKLRETEQGFDINTTVTAVSPEGVISATANVTLFENNTNGESRVKRRITSIGTGVTPEKAEDTALVRALGKLGL